MKKRTIFLILLIILALIYAFIKLNGEYDLTNKITGGVIAGAGLLLSRPRVASWMIIVIILGIIVYFSRNSIKNIIEKIKGKKEEI